MKGVVEKLRDQETIIIQSYSKKDEVFVDKDIRPMILNLDSGHLNLNEEILDVINEVSPCRMPGIFVTASVKQGTSIRPSEIIDVLTSQGLSVERPIKVGIELNEAAIFSPVN